ncbi:MAG: glutamate synthase subunit beta [Tessaracoccus sp.]
MADPKGFTTTRKVAERRPVVEERVEDWRGVPGQPGTRLAADHHQAGRTLYGLRYIPFCHNGLPGQLIPEWNDLVWRSDEWQPALERLHATNNFPEFTGRLCPAPCETASSWLHQPRCGDPVTKNVEVSIIDKAWDDSRVVPQQPAWHTAKTVAVIGSGPRAWPWRSSSPGPGLPSSSTPADRWPAGSHGIPEFKMEKAVLNRRLKQMVLEGTQFKTSVNIGVDITGPELVEMYEAVVLAIGSTVPRDLPVPGRDELSGIHQAMEYLPQANRVAVGQEVENQILATDKDVVIIGGGDTGADCLGTAIRQGARSITQLEIMPTPPEIRPAGQPWPTYPMTFKVTSAHEEGGDRVYAVSTVRFIGDDEGSVAGLDIVEVKFEGGRFVAQEGTERYIPAQLVLLAMGFTGPQQTGLVEQLGLELDPRGNITRDENYATNVDKVFACGDAGRGQSLIVWAIAEGRSCAKGVDEFLSGSSKLPRPIGPEVRQLLA